jgi:hypothetical protein
MLAQIEKVDGAPLDIYGQGNLIAESYEFGSISLKMNGTIFFCRHIK